MASSRLERIGTIYTRVKGLLRAGAMKEADKPLWYEVYEAFPPREEPHYGRVTPATPIRNILYEEDLIRAKFYKTYFSPAADLMNPRAQAFSQQFVDVYRSLAKQHVDGDDEQLLAAVENALEARGVRLRRKGAPSAPAPTAAPTPPSS